MDRSKDKVGYEINFNRHFYKYTPPRSLEKIDAELKLAEEENPQTPPGGDGVSVRSGIAFKSSGVQCLGEIPAHWQVMRLKFLAAPKPFAIVDGPFGTQLKAEEYVSEGIPLVRVGDLDFSGNLSNADFVYISEKNGRN